LLVINQKAGTQRKDVLYKLLQKGGKPTGSTVEIAETQHRGHGKSIAEHASKAGYDTIIAAGGDGSVNDIVNGLDPTRSKLGVIPMGSGNGLARALKIPLKPEAAIERIWYGTPMVMDVGQANERLFVSNAGIGFDAHVAHAFLKTTRRGLAGYAITSSKEIFRYKSIELTIQTETDSWTGRYFMANVANGSQFGYNFQIAPPASVTDGVLDIILIQMKHVLQAVPVLIGAFNGTITEQSQVQHIRSRKVTFTSPGLQHFQADGDVFDCNETVSFSVLPKYLTILV